MVLVFSCDEVIKLLKLILINGNFNNQVVKTLVIVYVRTALFENQMWKLIVIVYVKITLFENWVNF